VKVDGVSLLPTIRKGRKLRSTVLIQAGPQEDVDRRYGWWWRGVTTDRYTYAYYFAEGFEELYDRKYDPGETRNLSRLLMYRRTIAELRRRTGALKTCAGAASCSRPWGAVPGPLLGGLL
jgi:arylsulfatase A-like enzyme